MFDNFRLLVCREHRCSYYMYVYGFFTPSCARTVSDFRKGEEG